MQSEKYVMRLVETAYRMWGSAENVCGAILILPESVSVAETSYCVGQLEALITPEGFKNLIYGEWTEDEVHTGTNFIIHGIECLEEGDFDIRILQRKQVGRGRLEPLKATIVLPYTTDMNGKAMVYLQSAKPAVAHALIGDEDENGEFEFTPYGFHMDIFL